MIRFPLDLFPFLPSFQTARGEGARDLALRFLAEAGSEFEGLVIKTSGDLDLVSVGHYVMRVRSGEPLPEGAWVRFRVVEPGSPARVAVLSVEPARDPAAAVFGKASFQLRTGLVRLGQDMGQILSMKGFDEKNLAALVGRDHGSLAVSALIHGLALDDKGAPGLIQALASLFAMKPGLRTSRIEDLASRVIPHLAKGFANAGEEAPKALSGMDVKGSPLDEASDREMPSLIGKLAGRVLRGQAQATNDHGIAWEAGASAAVIREEPVKGSMSILLGEVVPVKNATPGDAEEVHAEMDVRHAEKGGRSAASQTGGRDTLPYENERTSEIKGGRADKSEPLRADDVAGKTRYRMIADSSSPEDVKHSGREAVSGKEGSPPWQEPEGLRALLHHAQSLSRYQGLVEDSFGISLFLFPFWFKEGKGFGEMALWEEPGHGKKEKGFAGPGTRLVFDLSMDVIGPLRLHVSCQGGAIYDLTLLANREVIPFLQGGLQDLKEIFDEAGLDLRVTGVFSLDERGYEKQKGDLTPGVTGGCFHLVT